MNNCPFKIGDRIFEIQDGTLATVTEITERGFKYEYDEMKHVIPILNLSYSGGECYCDLDYGEIGFELYTGNNKIKRPKF